MYQVYWIHHKDHNNLFTQGYVGVSNNTEKRFAKHKSQTNQNTHINPILTNVAKHFGIHIRTFKKRYKNGEL